MGSSASKDRAEGTLGVLSLKSRPGEDGAARDEVDLAEDNPAEDEEDEEEEEESPLDLEVGLGKSGEGDCRAIWAHLNLISSHSCA